MSVQEKWLVWSNEHSAWWRADRKGYCHRRSAAGRYSFIEALEIVRGANSHVADHEKPNEAMILDQPAPAARQHAGQGEE